MLKPSYRTRTRYENIKAGSPFIIDNYFEMKVHLIAL